MDILLLSRIQFAITVGFHFIFPAITIGLAWLNVIYLTRYRRTRSEDDLRLAYFWINIFAISFVMGVATGIVTVFQFGSNWSDYSRYVGNIFGAPLAAEAIVAFFLEATFIGILIWGRNRVSQGLYYVSGILVAAGTTLSAFLIIAANSWMQTPAGYIRDAAGNPVLDEFGRPQIDSFFATVFNPSTLPRFAHTVIACLIAGAMVVIGISAWYLLKKQRREFALRSIRPAIAMLLVTAVAQGAIGHWHTVQVVNTQPAKLAAFEGLFDTDTGVELILIGIPNEEKAETAAKIAIPKMLSFLAYGNFNAEVQGLNDFPRDEWPPVALSFFSYRTMLAFGGFFLIMGIWGSLLAFRNKLEDSRLFLKIALFTIPTGVIAAEIGWMAAEVGRQPWTVYGLLRTSESVSYIVPAIQVFFSIVMFLVIYILFFSAWIFLVRRKMAEGPEAFAVRKPQEEREGEI